MQREINTPPFGAKSLMVGLLAVLLLAFGSLAAGDALHHWAHHESTGDTKPCMICTLAQGQLNVLESAPVQPAEVVFLPCGLLAASAGVPWSPHSLLPPGRAPPGLSYSL